MNNPFLVLWHIASSVMWFFRWVPRQGRRIRNWLTAARAGAFTPRIVLVNERNFAIHQLFLLLHEYTVISDDDEGENMPWTHEQVVDAVYKGGAHLRLTGKMPGDDEECQV